MGFHEEMIEASEAIVDALGEPVSFNGTFGPYVIHGIFDEGATVVNDFNGGVNVEPHQLTVKTADLQPVKPHDEVRRGLTVYKVLTIDPDGEGLTVLTLYKTRED